MVARCHFLPILISNPAQCFSCGVLASHFFLVLFSWLLFRLHLVTPLSATTSCLRLIFCLPWLYSRHPSIFPSIFIRLTNYPQYLGSSAFSAACEMFERKDMKNRLRKTNRSVWTSLDEKDYWAWVFILCMCVFFYLLGQMKHFVGKKVETEVCVGNEGWKRRLVNWN